MRFRTIVLCCLIAAFAAFGTACHSNTLTTVKPKLSQSVDVSSASASADLLAPAPPSSTGIKTLAKKLHSSPGRVALSELINHLDSATVVSDMAKKSAKELFDQLRQTATQKAQTLEGLDRQYGLADILASEKIYVTIQANNVTKRAPRKPAKGWVKKFEKAIRKK